MCSSDLKPAAFALHDTRPTAGLRNRGPPGLRRGPAEESGQKCDCGIAKDEAGYCSRPCLAERAETERGAVFLESVGMLCPEII